MCGRELVDKLRLANQHARTRHTTLGTFIVSRQFRIISFRWTLAHRRGHVDPSRVRKDNVPNTRASVAPLDRPDVCVRNILSAGDTLIHWITSGNRVRRPWHISFSTGGRDQKKWEFEGNKGSEKMRIWREQKKCCWMILKAEMKKAEVLTVDQTCKAILLWRTPSVTEKTWDIPGFARARVRGA